MVLIYFKKNYWLALSAVGVLVSSAAIAQTTIAASSSAPLAASPSAFEGYKPYTDEPMANWKVANDSVAQIGGWREYAKQAQQPDNTTGMASRAVETAPKQGPQPTTKAKP